MSVLYLGNTQLCHLSRLAYYQQGPDSSNMFLRVGSQAEGLLWRSGKRVKFPIPKSYSSPPRVPLYVEPDDTLQPEPSNLRHAFVVVDPIYPKFKLLGPSAVNHEHLRPVRCFAHLLNPIIANSKPYNPKTKPRTWLVHARRSTTRRRSRWWWWTMTTRRRRRRAREATRISAACRTRSHRGGRR